jgi:Flp pilus assembly pilin Flp
MFVQHHSGVSMNLSLRRQQRGQGMTEYIIIVALIAVAAIGVYQFFGQTIRNQTAGIANEVAGKQASDQIQSAQDAADKATTEGTTRKGLDSYDSSGSR